MPPSTDQLPRLRNDIVLMEGPGGDGDSVVGWVIYDPVRHRYFQIDAFTVAVLAQWKAGDVRAVRQAVEENSAYQPTEDDISHIASFLHLNGLTDKQGQERMKTFLERQAGTHQQWRKALLNSYLFFRVPLIRPQRFLQATYVFVRPFYSRAALWIIFLILAAGLFLVGRQWEAFAYTFTAYGTWEGQVALLCAIALSKCIHEFGHAFTLHRHGGRVPTMGVAFLVMFPMLYTDTTDSWRLRGRKARLAVGAAGVVSELVLACLALFLWSFAEDGPIRSGLFVLASTVWVGTLAINASPFMKFDGYYLLSDYLGIPNLQDRSFALARWQIRRALFGLKVSPPEVFSSGRHRLLVGYAIATWLYRAVLFIGIALLVYHFFFKALGIALFVIEIWVFLVRPVLNELRIWWAARKIMKFNLRSAVFLSLFTALILALVYPWRTTITAPAIIEAAFTQPIYPPQAAYVESLFISNGDVVRKGDVIARLHSPELAYQHAQSNRELEILRTRIGQAQVGRQTVQNVDVLQRQATALESRLRGLEEQMSQMDIVAFHDGVIVDMPDAMRPGIWVRETEPVGWIAASKGAHIAIFIDEADVTQVRPGSTAVFFADKLDQNPIEAAIAEDSLRVVDSLEKLPVASVFGGRVEVTVEPDGTLRPQKALYQMVAVSGDFQVQQQLSGVVHMDAPARSIAERIFRRIMAVIIQESGF